MNTKSKQQKQKVKKPKPNLHGPNSPTPKKKVIQSESDQENNLDQQEYSSDEE